MQVIIFQKELYAYHWMTRKKNACTLSSHIPTRELYAKVPSHAPIGDLCEGSSMRLYRAIKEEIKVINCDWVNH